MRSCEYTSIARLSRARLCPTKSGDCRGDSDACNCRD
jgi:hypothetical protein